MMIVQAMMNLGMPLGGKGNSSVHPLQRKFYIIYMTYVSTLLNCESNLGLPYIRVKY